MKRIRSLLRTLTCLFRADCNVFPGDDFTRWADRKAEEAKRSAATLRASREVYERSNPITDAILGKRNHQ